MNRREIKAAKPGDTLRDNRVRDLRLRVFSERTVWYLYYRTRHGERRQPRLGDYPRMTITEARELAEEMLRDARAGADPSRAREIRKKTLGEVVEDYIRRHLSTKKNSKKTEALIRRCILPDPIARVPIDLVDIDDVEAMHKRLAATPYQANRAKSYLSAALSAAERWKLRPVGSGTRAAM